MFLFYFMYFFLYLYRCYMWLHLGSWNVLSLFLGPPSTPTSRRVYRVSGFVFFTLLEYFQLLLIVHYVWVFKKMEESLLKSRYFWMFGAQASYVIFILHFLFIVVARPRLNNQIFLHWKCLKRHIIKVANLSFLTVIFCLRCL